MYARVFPSCFDGFGRSSRKFFSCCLQCNHAHCLALGVSNARPETLMPGLPASRLCIPHLLRGSFRSQTPTPLTFAELTAEGRGVGAQMRICCARPCTKARGGCSGLASPCRWMHVPRVRTPKPAGYALGCANLPGMSTRSCHNCARRSLRWPRACEELSRKRQKTGRGAVTPLDPRKCMEPDAGLEPATTCLQDRGSTS